MDPAYVATHVEEDRRHWWFRGRLAVLLAILRRVLPPGHARLLELGCGTGNVLAALAEFGEAVGMETHPDLAAAARAAGLDVRTGRLPDDLVVPPGWADAVLLLDVIEHLDDDVAALETARRALRPGGLLVITVPAYRWMWRSATGGATPRVGSPAWWSARASTSSTRATSTRSSFPPSR